ncbi:MAG: hypothetical protein KDK23_07950 [Leptospiraceae bacterium]|nr:hypothetical protein [Leptospiraceae bacterium]
MAWNQSGSVRILDESLLYFGLLIGTMLTGWSLWMLFLYIMRSPEERKRNSVRLWIILIALLLGLGALGKPLRELIQKWTGNVENTYSAPVQSIASPPRLSIALIAAESTARQKEWRLDPGLEIQRALFLEQFPGHQTFHQMVPYILRT